MKTYLYVKTTGFNRETGQDTDDTFHANVDFVNCDPEKQIIRNHCDRRFDDDDIPGLADLQITSQGNSKRYSTGERVPAEERQLYAWDVEYRDVYSADLSRLQSMVKMLQKIDRSLVKARASDGREQSFGQYCLRVGKSIGAAGMIFKAAGNGCNYSENEYKFTDLAAGMSFVDRLVEEWQLSVDAHGHKQAETV